MDSTINEAILHAHHSGVLHGASLMMGQKATDEAVEMARAHFSLQTGVHFHLVDSIPTTTSHWPWGDSPARAGISLGVSEKARQLMRREIRRQWELYRQTGLPCHFVNTHHHLHAHPAVFREIQEVVGPDFRGRIRLGEIRFFPPAPAPWNSARIVQLMFKRARKLSPWKSTDTLWGLDRLGAMKPREILDAMANLQEGFHEFLFHPRSLSCPDTRCLLELKELLPR